MMILNQRQVEEFNKLQECLPQITKNLNVSSYIPSVMIKKVTKDTLKNVLDKTSKLEV
jgi:hypothetical protein